MKQTLSLVETLLHRGFNKLKSIFNKTLINKLINKLALFLVIFTLGMIFGQNLLMNKITDDCRILRATRFGEVYISCGTAQKL